MKKLFETDGMRGVVNTELTAHTVFWVGMALGFMAKDAGLPRKVFVGKDTRTSGTLFENALAAGLLSARCDVVLGGVMPTPAVGYITLRKKFAYGVMISASHNPKEHNGIKIFNQQGNKLAQKEESQLIKLFHQKKQLQQGLTASEVGQIYQNNRLINLYQNFITGKFDAKKTKPIRIILDLANGAANGVAQKIVQKLKGISAQFIHANKDGNLINLNCGATNVHTLKQEVLRSKADVGFAFDGDADRIIMVDETGQEVDGDKILYIAGTYLKKQGLLKDNIVVGTVFSGAALAESFKPFGITLLRTPVGDKYVKQKMQKCKASLGGETCGHILFGKESLTGDGLLVMVLMLNILRAQQKPLSHLLYGYKTFYRKTVNVPVTPAYKHALKKNADLCRLVEECENVLFDAGRILVRPSGTENLVRVLVEGYDKKICDQLAGEIAAFIQKQN